MINLEKSPLNNNSQKRPNNSIYKFQRLFGLIIISLFAILVLSSTSFASSVNISASGQFTLETPANAVYTGSPYAVNGSINSFGSYLYASNNNNNLTIINLTGNSIIKNIAGFEDVEGVAVSPNGDYVYVMGYNNKLFTINTVTDSIVSNVIISNLSTPSGLAVSPNGNYLYIPNYGSGTLSIYNISSNSISNTISGFNAPDAVTVSPNGSYVYVGNYGSSNNKNISVVSLATNSILMNISKFNVPNGLAISPNGKHLYVSNYGNGSLSIYNISSNSISNTISGFSGIENVGVSPNGNYVYVSNYVSSSTITNGKIRAINLETNSMTTIINGTNNYGYELAVSPVSSSVIQEMNVIINYTNPSSSKPQTIYTANDVQTFNSVSNVINAGTYDVIMTSTSNSLVSYSKEFIVKPSFILNIPSNAIYDGKNYSVNGSISSGEMNVTINYTESGSSVSNTIFTDNDIPSFDANVINAGNYIVTEVDSSNHSINETKSFEIKEQIIPTACFNFSAEYNTSSKSVCENNSVVNESGDFDFNIVENTSQNVNGTLIKTYNGISNTIYNNVPLSNNLYFDSNTSAGQYKFELILNPNDENKNYSEVIKNITVNLYPYISLYVFNTSYTGSNYPTNVSTVSITNGTMNIFLNNKTLVSNVIKYNLSSENLSAGNYTITANSIQYPNISVSKNFTISKNVGMTAMLVYNVSNETINESVANYTKNLVGTVFGTEICLYNASASINQTTGCQGKEVSSNISLSKPFTVFFVSEYQSNSIITENGKEIGTTDLLQNETHYNVFHFSNPEIYNLSVASSGTQNYTAFTTTLIVNATGISPFVLNIPLNTTYTTVQKSLTKIRNYTYASVLTGKNYSINGSIKNGTMTAIINYTSFIPNKTTTIYSNSIAKNFSINVSSAGIYNITLIDNTNASLKESKIFEIKQGSPNDYFSYLTNNGNSNYGMNNNTINMTTPFDEYFASYSLYSNAIINGSVFGKTNMNIINGSTESILGGLSSSGVLSYYNYTNIDKTGIYDFEISTPETNNYTADTVYETVNLTLPKIYISVPKNTTYTGKNSTISGSMVSGNMSVSINYTSFNPDVSNIIFEKNDTNSFSINVNKAGIYTVNAVSTTNSSLSVEKVFEINQSKINSCFDVFPSNFNGSYQQVCGNNKTIDEFANFSLNTTITTIPKQEINGSLSLNYSGSKTTLYTGNIIDVPETKVYNKTGFYNFSFIINGNNNYSKENYNLVVNYLPIENSSGLILNVPQNKTFNDTSYSVNGSDTIGKMNVTMLYKSFNSSATNLAYYYNYTNVSNFTAYVFNAGYYQVEETDVSNSSINRVADFEIQRGIPEICFYTIPVIEYYNYGYHYVYYANNTAQSTCENNQTFTDYGQFQFGINTSKVFNAPNGTLILNYTNSNGISIVKTLLNNSTKYTTINDNSNGYMNKNVGIYKYELLTDENQNYLKSKYNVEFKLYPYVNISITNATYTGSSSSLSVPVAKISTTNGTINVYLNGNEIKSGINGITLNTTGLSAGNYTVKAVSTEYPNDSISKNFTIYRAKGFNYIYLYSGIQSANTLSNSNLISYSTGDSICLYNTSATYNSTTDCQGELENHSAIYLSTPFTTVFNSSFNSSLILNNKTIFSNKNYPNDYIYNNTSKSGVYVFNFTTLESKNYTRFSSYLNVSYDVKLIENIPANRSYNGKNWAINGSISTGKMNVFLNGKEINSSVSNFTYASSNAGNYTIKEVSVSDVHYYLEKKFSIYKIKPVLNLSVFKNTTYTGLNSTMKGNISSVLSQLKGELYISNIPVLSTNGSFEYNISNAGNYIITFNTTGNNNYTANSITKYATINKANAILKLDIVNNSSIGYGSNYEIIANIISFKNQLQGSVSVGNTIILNNLYGNSTNHIQETKLSAGTYTFNLTTNGNNNYNPNATSEVVKIIKAKPVIDLSVFNTTYTGSDYPISGKIISVNSQLNGNLLINNSVVISNNSTFYNDKNAEAGKYIIEIETKGNDNYTANNITETGIIRKAVPSITTKLPSNVYYSGINYSYLGKISSYDNQVYGNMYLNGKSVSPNSNYYIGNVVSAGNYTLKINTIANNNYTNVSKIFNFSILKATPIMSINVSDFSNYTGQPVNAILTIKTFNNQLNASAYYMPDKTLISNSITNSIVASEISAGTYDINFITNGNKNYTANSANKQFIINKIKPNESIELITNGTIIANRTTYNSTPLYVSGIFNVSFISNTVNNQLIITPYENGTFLPSFSTNENKQIIGYGNYTFNITTNGNNNYTSTKVKMVVIDRKMLNLSVPSNTTYTGENSTISGNIFKGTMSVLVNGNPVFTKVKSFTYNVSSAGIYNITEIDNAQTSKTLNKSFVIKKAVPKYNITIPSPKDLLFGKGIKLVSTSITTFNNQLEYTTDINNETYNSTSVFLADEYNIGKYNITIHSNGNNNYTAFSESKNFSIASFPTPISLSVCSNFTYDGKPCTINATTSYGLFARLYLNNKSIAKFNKTYSLNLTNAGNYSLMLKTNGNATYGANATSESFFISKAMPKYEIIVSTYGVRDIVNNTSPQTLYLANLPLPIHIEYVVSTYDNQLPFSLYVNGRHITNVSTSYNYTITNMSQTQYQFTFNTTGNNNYIGIDPTIYIYQNALKSGSFGTNFVNNTESFQTYGNYTGQGVLIGFNGKLEVINLPTNTKSTIYYHYISPPANTSITYTKLTNPSILTSVNYTQINQTTSSSQTIMNYTFVNIKAGTYIFKLTETNSSGTVSKYHVFYLMRGITKISGVSQNASVLNYGQTYTFNYNGNIKQYSDSLDTDSSLLNIFKPYQLNMYLYIDNTSVYKLNSITQPITFNLYPNGTAKINGKSIYLSFLNPSNPNAEINLTKNIYLKVSGDNNYTNAISKILTFKINQPSFSNSSYATAITTTPFTNDMPTDYITLRSSYIGNLMLALAKPTIKNNTLNDNYVLAEGYSPLSYNLGIFATNGEIAGHYNNITNAPSPISSSQGIVKNMYAIDTNFAEYNPSKYIIPLELHIYSPYIFLNSQNINFKQEGQINEYKNAIQIKYYNIGTGKYVNITTTGTLHLKDGNNLTLDTNSPVIDILGTNGEKEEITGRIYYNYPNTKNTSYSFNNYTFKIGQQHTIIIDVGTLGYGRFRFRTVDGNNGTQFYSTADLIYNNSTIGLITMPKSNYSLPSITLKNGQTYHFDNITYNNVSYNTSLYLFCPTDVAYCNETLYVFPPIEYTTGYYGTTENGDGWYGGGSGGACVGWMCGTGNTTVNNTCIGNTCGKPTVTVHSPFCNATGTYEDGRLIGEPCPLPPLGVNFTFVITLNGSVLFPDNINPHEPRIINITTIAELGQTKNGQKVFLGLHVPKNITYNGTNEEAYGSATKLGVDAIVNGKEIANNAPEFRYYTSSVGNYNVNESSTAVPYLRLSGKFNIVKAVPNEEIELIENGTVVKTIVGNESETVYVSKPFTTKFISKTYKNQLYANVIANNESITSINNETSLSYSTLGNYSFKLATNGNHNYTAVDPILNVKYVKTLPTPLITINVPKNTTIVKGVEYCANGSINVGTMNVSINGIEKYSYVSSFKSCFNETGNYTIKGTDTSIPSYYVQKNFTLSSPSITPSPSIKYLTVIIHEKIVNEITANKLNVDYLVALVLLTAISIYATKYPKRSLIFSAIGMVVLILVSFYLIFVLYAIASLMFLLKMSKFKK